MQTETDGGMHRSTITSTHALLAAPPVDARHVARLDLHGVQIEREGIDDCKEFRVVKSPFSHKSGRTVAPKSKGRKHERRLAPHNPNAR